jgi:hypothetical protein
MSDETRRIIIKKGIGIATIPSSSDHRDGSWLSTDIYEGEFYLDTATGIIYTRVGSTINVSSQPKVSVYKGLINQTSTSAPVFTSLVNTLGSIVWTRSSSGTYLGTLTGAFTSSKTVLLIGTAQQNATDEIRIHRNNANQIHLFTYSSGTLTDGILIDTALSIEIYA